MDAMKEQQDRSSVVENEERTGCLKPSMSLEEIKEAFEDVGFFGLLTAALEEAFAHSRGTPTLSIVEHMRILPDEGLEIAERHRLGEITDGELAAWCVEWCEDVIAAEEALREYREDPVTHPFADLVEMLGLTDETEDDIDTAGAPAKGPAGADFSSFLAEQLQDPELKAEWDALEPEFAAKQAAIDARIAAEDSNTPYLSDALRGILVNDCDDKRAREERLAKYTRPTIEELFEGYDGSYAPTEIDWGEPVGADRLEAASDMSAYPACFFESEQGYSAVFPDLNWLATDGSSLAEVRQRAAEILSCYLQWAREDGDPIPPASKQEEIDPAAIAAELESSAAGAWVEMVETADIAEIEAMGGECKKDGT